MARSVTVWHSLPADDIEARIARLGMGAERLDSGPADGLPAARPPMRPPSAGPCLAAGHQRGDVRD
jgi:hypothetical protein